MLARVQHAPTNRRRVWCHSITKCCPSRSHLKGLDDPYTMGQNVLPTHLWFGVGNHFFFFFFFSSKFMSAHSKFQTSPFNFFFLCIWSMSFILLFFIFNNLQNYFRPTSQVAPRPSRLAFWPNLGVKQFNSELT